MDRAHNPLWLVSIAGTLLSLFGLLSNIFGFAEFAAGMALSWIVGCCLVGLMSDN